MVYGLIVAVHILVCFFIIVVVLLQSGKSGDISAAFGGQGSQTAFGPRGAASAPSPSPARNHTKLVPPSRSDMSILHTQTSNLDGTSSSGQRQLQGMRYSWQDCMAGPKRAALRLQAMV
jgi:preprotein translocase subunit SecG